MSAGFKPLGTKSQSLTPLPSLTEFTRLSTHCFHSLLTPFILYKLISEPVQQYILSNPNWMNTLSNTPDHHTASGDCHRTHVVQYSKFCPLWSWCSVWELLSYSMSITDVLILTIYQKCYLVFLDPAVFCRSRLIKIITLNVS